MPVFEQTRRAFRLLKTGFWVVAVSGIVFSACSPQKRFQVLSIFFDGVPAQDSTLTAISKQKTEPNDTTQNGTSENLFTTERTYFHAPYRQRKCKDCHAGNNVSKFITTKQMLCLSCHKDVIKNFKHTHGPAESSGCYFCHAPHKSKYEKLLVFPKDDLCFQCHESNRILQTKFHISASSQNCTECHSTHGSSNRYLLKRHSCYKCHSNFETEYKFIHGPVAGQYCSACHKRHNNKETELTAYKQELCFQCHIKSDITKNPVHDGMGDANCMMCHNPHGGDDKFLLN